MNRLSIMLSVNPWKFKTLVATLSTTTSSFDRNSANRQGKILGKLFGNRLKGSKRKWYENPMNSSGQPNMDNTLNFNNPKKSDSGSLRRINVLNKLFMTHITDLLATGQASDKILGKGLQVTRVKVTPNFQFCNVYWLAKGITDEVELEEELKKCGGFLRHELSQLRLMGEVPRIHFVKDKTFANLANVETVLQKADFGEDHRELNPSLEMERDLYQIPEKAEQKNANNNEEEEDDDDEEPLPEMRHDVFGVDRRAIMGRILAKLKRSEKAWEQHRKIGDPTEAIAQQESVAEKLKQKLAEANSENDEKFREFIKNKMAEKRQRFKFRTVNEKYYRRIGEDDYDSLEDGDYIEEDNEGKK